MKSNEWLWAAPEQSTPTALIRRADHRLRYEPATQNTALFAGHQGALPIANRIDHPRPGQLVALCDRVLQLEQAPTTLWKPADILNAPEYYLSKQRSDFENILHAEVIEHGAHTTRLHYQGASLLMPKASAAVGEKIYLSLPARELIIARQPSDQLSARNQIPARIVQQHLDRPVALLELATQCEHSTLFAEITLDASQQLQLKVDDSVWVIFKSSSLTACT